MAKKLVPSEGDSWTDEVVAKFEALVFSAKWKVIMASVIKEAGKFCVELVDTHGDKVLKLICLFLRFSSRILDL